MAMKFRYLPPIGSIALRSPVAYSLSWAGQSAQTSSLLAISRAERTSAPLAAGDDARPIGHVVYIVQLLRSPGQEQLQGQAVVAVVLT